MILTNIGLGEASHNPIRMHNGRRRKVTTGVALVGVLIASALTGAALGQSARPRLSDIRLGISNYYKVGHWTAVWAEVEGEVPPAARVEVTVADSDGVATTADAPLEANSAQNGRSAALVYTRVGRVGAPIRVALVDDGQLLAERTLHPNPDLDASSKLVEVPATSELLVSLSANSFGLEQAIPEREAGGGEVMRRTVRLERINDLPVDWFGYEAVDLLVISAGDGALCRALAADKARFSALVRWVELGGRLVVFCGGESARELLAEGGPLAALVPGKFDDVVRLTETASLEHFAQPAPSIGRAGSGIALLVPRLTDIDGRIEVHAGRQPTDLPLVIRAPRGLGEVAFVGVDPAAPPLADWKGRTRFLQALLEPYIAGPGLDSPQTLMTLGYNDLSGALRQRLGRAFGAVGPFSFPMVATLAVAYLLVLGPLDYWLVHRWLRQPLVAWITFPLMVILFGMGGLTLAEWRKGTGGVRVNCLELIDVDASTRHARGTFWSSLYTPDAKQFDLAVDAKLLETPRPSKANVLLSWWGLPGVGIGGMQAGGANPGIVRQAYRYADDRAALVDLPVLASSTKSLAARWTASDVEMGALLEAPLHDENGFATGSLVNRSGQMLHDAHLFYGPWGYRLGNVADGQQIEVGEQLDPLTVKTIVARSALGGPGAVVSRDSVFMPERASAVELLRVMMFYDVAGGLPFGRLPSRYQAYCDLSRLLTLGRAILVANVDGQGSRLIDRATGEPMGDEYDDLAPVVLRVVLPVTKRADTP